MFHSQRLSIFSKLKIHLENVSAYYRSFNFTSTKQGVQKSDHRLHCISSYLTTALSSLAQSVGNRALESLSVWAWLTGAWSLIGLRQLPSQRWGACQLLPPLFPPVPQQGGKI